MSTTIDQRVVEMQFDNRQFERNVQTSMSTIDKLKQSLNLTGAAKGINEVNNAARSFNLSGMTNAAETVAAKFSYMQMTIQHQLNRIVDSAVATGKRITSALTIDPIKTGFQEYETQINAVQTILANTESKGTTLNDVNGALDELNTYADKTIYNFTEMTRNIGTFTAAGVDLDKSVTSIKGIANLAAVSGSTSQQASTAMYQLSQALAAGRVSLMDWNSVVNAGMGGELFQNALKRTAENMGHNVDAIIKKYGSFRESLTKGEWLTADVLTETLTQLSGAYTEADLIAKGYTKEQAKEITKLADTAVQAATKVKTFTQLWDTLKESAQSGWTQTWELLVGDFGESKELWTGISDTIGEMINASAESRNTLLEGALNTNWEKLISNINEAGIGTDTFNEKLTETVKKHGLDVDKLIEEHGSLEKAFRSGAISSDILDEAVKSLTGNIADLSKVERELKKGLKGDDVKEIQKILKSQGFDLGKTGIDGSFGSKTEAAIKAFQELNGLEVTGIVDDKTLKALEEANSKTKKLSSSCKDLIANITELGGRERLLNSFKNIFKGIMSVVKPVKEAFREIFPPTTAEQLLNVIKSFEKFTEKLKLSDEQSKMLKTTFKGLFSVVDIGLTFIKDLVSGAVKLIGNFTGLGTGILGVTSSFGEWLIHLRNSVKESDVFGKSIDSIVNFLTNGITAVKDFGKSIADNFKMPEFDGFFNTMKSLWSFISRIGSSIGELFSSIGKGIGNAFNESGFFDTLNTGLTGGILAGIAKFIWGLGNPFEEVGGILENITGILEDVRGCFEAYQNQLKADTLMKIAKAIGILAAAIFVIALIDQDKLTSSLGAITVLFGELLGSLTVFTKIGGAFKGAIKAIGLMTAMSISILLLASAMKILSTMDWNQIAKGLVGVGILMAELAGFIYASKFTGNLKGTAINIVFLSTAMLIMAKAVKNFSSMDWSQIARGLTGMAGALGAVVLALNLMPKNWAASFGGITQVKTVPNLISAGIAFVTIAASMKIFASAMRDFAFLEWEEIGKGLLGMAGALGAVTLALRFMPTNTFAIGSGVLVMAAAMKVLASALESFGGMSWDEIVRGLVAMGVALGELSVGLILMSGTISGSAALLVAAGAMTIFVPVLKSLGEMSWGEIVKGLVTLAGAFTIIGLAGFVLRPLVPTILQLAGAMALMGLSIVGIGAGLTLIGVGLTAISTGITALGTSLAVGATALVAGLTVIITGVLDLIPTVISKLGEGIVALCEVVIECAPQLAETILVVISEVLSALATYIPQIVDSLMTFVIGLLNAFSEKLPELIQAAVNVIASFFQGVVDALAGLDVSGLLKGIAGVGLLTGLMIALSAAASFVPGAMTGVLGMGIVIAEMAAMIAVLGGIAQIPGLSWLIEEGGNFLQVLGTAIGQFIGGIAGGIAQGVTASLPQMGTDLSNFMTNIQPFIEGVKAIDASAMEGVKSLVGIILGLSAANVIESLTSWFTGGSSLASFGAEIAAFGPYIKQYADSIAGIDAEAVAASANAGKALAQMTSYIPNEGGMVAWFTGENSISKFGTELVTLGTGLKAYSMAIVGFNAEAVIASANAAKALADMTSHIPNEGGMVAWFTGENSVSKFSSDLVTLAIGLKAYSMAIVGFNADAVTASINAAKAIADMTTHIPNEGGIAAWFTGENSVTTFASQLPVLGTGLRMFSQSVEGINVENMTGATGAAKALANMANTIPNEGGVVAWFTGENSIANFASQLPKLGKGLKGFSTEVEGINAENVTAAANSAKALAEMAKIVPSEGGIKAWFTGENAISKFASQLPTLGKGLKGFSESVKGIVPENVTAAASAAKSLAQMADTTPKNTGKIVDFGENLVKFGGKIKSYFEKTSGVTGEAILSSTKAINSIKNSTSGLNSGNVTSAANAIDTMVDSLKKMSKVKASDADGFNNALKKLGESNVKTIVSTFDDAGPKLLNAGKELIGEFVKGVGKKDADVKKAGQKALEKFISGIESKESAAKTACKDVISACATAMSKSTSKFSTVGKSLVKGFASGISANTYLATAKAKAMANAAEKAAKEALDINSPSKVFRSIGYSVPEGFAMGIDKMRRLVTVSSSDMATSAIGNVKDSISRMADIINSDIDSQPTIRPVVDLSNVKAGANSINSMFGNGFTIDTAHVNRISTLMNQRNQNGANDDIVSAINKLRKEVGNVGGNTYNVNGITYNDDGPIADAIGTLIRHIIIEGRV